MNKREKFGESELCRSREGAWIEMELALRIALLIRVAPVRERGLKCHGTYNREGSASVAPVRERGLK